LGDFQVGAFFISDSKLKSFLFENPNLNNQFDFLKREAVYLEYSIIIRNNVTQANDIIDEIDDAYESLYDDLVVKYL